MSECVTENQFSVTENCDGVELKVFTAHGLITHVFSSLDRFNKYKDSCIKSARQNFCDVVKTK